MAKKTNELRCSVYIATSLDGYIARRDGGIDWLSAVQISGEDYGYRAFMDSVDTIVIGRKTYDLAVSFESWPYAGKRCVVLTHRRRASAHGEIFLDASPEEVATRLAHDRAHRVYVDGGGVIQQFLAARLVTDITLSIVPVVLGDGIRLFAEGGPEQRLVLEEARSWSSGLAQLRYRVPRD